MAYQSMEWRDGASGGTPLNAENLNNMIEGIDEAHERLNIDEESLNRKLNHITITDSVTLEDCDKYTSPDTLYRLYIDNVYQLLFNTTDNGAQYRFTRYGDIYFRSYNYNSNSWSDWVNITQIPDGTVTKEKLSEEIQNVIDAWYSTNYLQTVVLGNLSDTNAFNSPNFAGLDVIYHFKATGDLAGIFGCDSNSLTDCELYYHSPYQIVTVVSTQRKFIREVTRIAPSFNATEWREIELPVNSVSMEKLDIDLQATINSKADIETGTIPNNQAWYADNPDYKMVGTYELNGSYCTITATAHRVSGWGIVYYSLPVSAIGVASTIVVGSSKIYTIQTNVQGDSNISVLEIKTIDGSMQTDGTVSFTLRYKYK